MPKSAATPTPGHTPIDCERAGFDLEDSAQEAHGRLNAVVQMLHYMEDPDPAHPLKCGGWDVAIAKEQIAHVAQMLDDAVKVCEKARAEAGAR